MEKSEFFNKYMEEVKDKSGLKKYYRDYSFKEKQKYLKEFWERAILKYFKEYLKQSIVDYQSMYEFFCY